MNETGTIEQVFFELLDVYYRESELLAIHAGIYSGIVGFVILILSTPYTKLNLFGRTVIAAAFVATSYMVFEQILRIYQTLRPLSAEIKLRIERGDVALSPELAQRLADLPSLRHPPQMTILDLNPAFLISCPIVAFIILIWPLMARSAAPPAPGG